MCHFKAHAATAKHKAALAEPGSRAPFEAPSPAAFAKVFSAFHKRKLSLGEGGLESVGNRQKVTCMIYCLAEAVRQRTRIWLSCASSLTIHSDASQGRLLARGQMCGHDLCPRYCLLGTEILTNDPSALGISDAIMRALRDLATPLCSSGSTMTAPRPPDLPALKHICSIVEVFNADAASDEQLAGTLVAGALANDVVGGSAPPSVSSRT